MADVLPTPRATPEAEEKKATVNSSREKLEAALDELLKRYLVLLDEYTQAREQLSSNLSSGYISLAQANFNASHRVRYGQDFYDERMQALRRVTVEEQGSKLSRSIRLVDPPAKSTDEHPNEKPASSKLKTAEQNVSEGTTDDVSESVAKLELEQKEYADPTSHRRTPPPDGENEKDSKTENKKAKKENQRTRSDDPIRWFGILVPPALRSAQNSFVRAVEGPVPQLVDLAAEMRELEIEIGRTRKAIRKSER